MAGSITVLTHPVEARVGLTWLETHPGRLALDTETSDADGVVTDPDFVCGVVVLGHESGDALVLEGREPELVKPIIRAAFADGRKVWAHNARYDAWVMRRVYGLALTSLRDSLTAAQTVWPGRRGDRPYSLKNLRPTTQDAQDALREMWTKVAAEEGLRRPVGDERHWLPTAVEHLRVGDCPELAAYAAEDAVETARLVGEIGALTQFRKPVLKQVRVDQAWRWTGFQGIRVDVAGLEAAYEELDAKLEATQSEFGVKLWTNNGARNRYLTETLGITPARDRDGKVSWSKKVRPFAIVPEGSRETWERVQQVMAAASVLGKMREILDAADEHGYIHPEIGANTPAGTTGRMSIRRPALQNLAKGEDDVEDTDFASGASLRGLLIANPGKVLVGADLTHVEPSIMAALSGDPVLTAAVQPGVDPYIAAASAVWPEAATSGGAEWKRYRGRGKLILLALMYGMGNRALAAATRTSEAEAKRIRRRVLGAWRGVDRWIKRARRDAELGREQLTVGGRPIPNLQRKRGEEFSRSYAATNYLIQGSAADLFKQMTLDVAASLPPGARLWLPVHDELVVECEPDDAEEVAAILERCMSVEIHGVPIWAEPEVMGMDEHGVSRWRK